MDSDLHWLPAWELRARMAARQLSPVEVMTALLERVDRIGPKLNPFITVAADRALEEAARAENAIVRGEELGSLHGVPVSVKDAFWTEGIRTTYGSTVFEDFVPDQDSAFVASLRKSGAIIFAKANLPEFSVTHRTLNLLTPECVTPWDPSLDRSSGGSSGGSAVAVAAGLGPVSIGSDGGGSIRLPSALNGVVGFVAGRGRVPEGPGTYHSALQLVGPITRDVRDTALVMSVIAGDDPTGASMSAMHDDFADLEVGIAGLRVAWSDDFGFIEPMRRDVVGVAREAAHSLAALGANVDEPGLRLQNVLDVFEPERRLAVGHAAPPPAGTPSLAQFLAALREDPSRWAQCTPYVQAYAEGRIDNPTLLQYAMSIRPSVRNRTVDHLDEVFARYDLLAAPTISCLAFTADDPAITWQSYTAYTVIVNVSGYAALSIPVGFVDGFPVGLQLIAPPEREILLLRAARALEQARPFAHHHPPVS